jgi:ubiquinone/menaquinone biosynthesis C-methylase UbiE
MSSSFGCKKQYTYLGAMTYYNTISDSYEELHRDEQIKKIKLIAQNLNKKPTDKILDVGCGPCWTTEFFQNVTGVDPAERLLDKTKNVIKAPAEKLPFKDHEFDIILCITAIHHFDLDKAIKEMIRVGKNQFIITVLKKSPKKQIIINKLKQHFTIEKETEEEKDLIYFLKARTT